MLYYGKKLVIFIISVGLLSLVTAYDRPCFTG